MPITAINWDGVWCAETQDYCLGECSQMEVGSINGDKYCRINPFVVKKNNSSEESTKNET